MGRPPEVFVRPVTMTEGQRLQRIGRTAKDPVKLRRAIVVLMSAQGQSAPDIAHLLDCTQEYVRTVIHAFNESGFAALDPKWSGGRPKTFSEQVRRQVHVCSCRPEAAGRVARRRLLRGPAGRPPLPPPCRCSAPRRQQPAPRPALARRLR